MYDALLRIIWLFQVDSSAISHREGDSLIRRGFDIFNERGRRNSMGISTDRGYAIIIRHRFAGVTVRSLVSNPVSVPPHLSTEIQGASVVLPLSPFCQDAVPLANSDCSHGDARGGEAVQSVAMATYRHWTPFTPHFAYVLSPCTVIRRPDNIVPYRAKNTGLLLRS